MAVPLRLGQITLDSLPTSSPNLMPFKIGYNGPAPMATYFLVEPDNTDGVPEPAIEQVDASEGQISVNTSPTILEETSNVVEHAKDASLNAPPTNVVTKDDATTPQHTLEKPGAITRFISSFRGRMIRGSTVDLPVGYVGVVFSSDGTTTASGATTNKSKSNAEPVTKRVKRVFGKKGGRGTRNNSRVDDEEDEAEQEQEQEEGFGMDVDERSQEEEVQPARTLLPTSQFSSFVVWTPDIPLDEGRDEYVRSLREWVGLAEIVSSIFSGTTCLLNLLLDT